MLKPVVAILASLLPAVAGELRLSAQDQRRAASFAGDGSVTWDELYLELARRHRGKPFGKEALEHLVEKRIVGLEAAERGIRITAAEVDAALAALRQGLAAQKISLEQHLDDRAMSLSEFRGYLELSLLYDRVARHDLGLGKDDELTAAKRKLWLREKERKHATEIDPSKLPTDVAALLGEEPITLRELGHAMARNLVDRERDSILRQMVAYRLLLAEAAQRGVTPTAADQEAEIARRRQEFEADPHYQELGLTLEKLLAAQGRTLEDMRQGEVFRAEVLVRLLGARMFPDSEMEKAYASDVLRWQGRVGASRNTMLVLVQGPPRRTWDEARKRCEELRGQVRGVQEFQLVARQCSDDEESKSRGGQLGYVHREEPGRDDALLAAAFQLNVDEVSGPVKLANGYALLLVTRIEPGPQGEALWDAMRRFEMGRWLRELVEKADIKLLPMPK